MKTIKGTSFIKVIGIIFLFCVLAAGGWFFFSQTRDKDLLELESRIVVGLTERFLLAYEAKDIEGLIELFERSGNILFYGIDLGDRAENIADIKMHFEILFSTIETLHFRSTKPESIQISDDGKMATAFCELPAEITFRKDKSQSVAIILRFVLVWRKESGVWRICQAGTFLATSGRSAQELTGP
jgi:ketosteroid isomerase-like protein